MLSRFFVVTSLVTRCACHAPPPPPPFAFNYSNTLSDGAVLQRNVRAAVFGFGPVFAHFSVSLAANATGAPLAVVAGVVGSDGAWRVQLPPQPAGGPFMITGALLPGYWTPPNATAWALHDILFGDVIVCGGQSNMAYGVGGIKDASADTAAAARYPSIRFLSSQFSFQNFSQSQQANSGPGSGWVAASPATVGGFSAVCYLTATRISDHFRGALPLGLIDTSVGGTAAELWLPPRHASACADYMTQDWTPPWTLSCWWNGMAAPWTQHDVALFLWDQGENNVAADPNEAYTCLFAAVIAAWREAWRAPSAPFFFVQLPAYTRANDTALAATRDAQLAVADAVPGVGFAVTADLGDAYLVCNPGPPPQCYDGSIHNRDKDRVADRLAPAVLAGAYGVAGVPFLAPRYAGATQVRDAVVRVSLAAAALPPAALPLEVRPPDFSSNSSWCPYDGAGRLVEPRSCGWFAVLWSDGVWRNATPTVTAEGDALELTCATAAGLKALATSNGYADWPVVSVYTRTGLPLVPWGPRNVSATLSPHAEAADLGVAQAGLLQT